MSPKNRESASELDLFGHPVGPLRDPRGRPSFAKTKENQGVVISLKAAGQSQAEIAAYLGCDEKTLRKHFSRELDNAAAFLEGMALQSLVKKMREGNVAASKAVLEAARKGRAAPPPKAKASAPLGKKEEARRDAARPPSTWGSLLGEDSGPLN